MATDIELLQETHDCVIELKTILLGSNGYKGLCQVVADQGEDIQKIKGRPGRQSMKAWQWVAGVLAITIAGIFGSLVTIHYDRQNIQVPTAMVSPANQRK